MPTDKQLQSIQNIALSLDGKDFIEYLQIIISETDKISNLTDKIESSIKGAALTVETLKKIVALFAHKPEGRKSTVASTVHDWK